MRSVLFPLVLVAVAVLVYLLMKPEPEPDVVLYCGVDQDQSQQISAAYEKETGQVVRYEGETEAQRSVGLERKLLAEKASPRADVYWSNEIRNMVNVGRRGILAPLPEGVAERFPPMWRDPAGRYVAFGARARIFLVNTKLLPDEKDHPKALQDLLDPRYAEMGFTTSMAVPLTGTTYTHAVAMLTRDEEAGKAFLAAVAKAATEGRVRLARSNGSAMKLARDPEEKVAFCLTDTDDAWKAIQDGFPVKVIYPDQGEGEIGTVLIPNTVALVAGGPHPDAGAKLLEWLVSPENEKRLAEGPSAQIPLRPELRDVDLPAHVKKPGVDFRPAVVDWQAVGENSDRWLDWLNTTFRPAE